MKKIGQKVGDIWCCAKCDVEFLECDYRYILKVDLEDVTGSIHGVIAFDDAANQLMGISAKYICLLSTETTSLDEIVQRIYNKKLLLSLSIKIETFYRVARLKVVIVMVETHINYNFRWTHKYIRFFKLVLNHSSLFIMNAFNSQF